MNKKFLFFVILLILIVFLLTGLRAQSQAVWSAGTAKVLPEGRKEIGLFQPLRYGWSDNVELSLHPLYFLIIPNLRIKWHHADYKNMIFSSRHGFYYPTFLLRTLTREGTGGIISPEFNTPSMFALNNEILISTDIKRTISITGKVGITAAIKFGGLDQRTTIDLPLVYPRLNVFYHGYGLHGGTDFESKIRGRWFCLIDGDFYFTPSAESDRDFAFEHKMLIYWRKSGYTEFCFGYKLVYAEYPFGAQWHLFAPLFDIQFAWD